ncbi:MAG: GNAT family N-acetyltransferase [Candidatus Accumulibacter phosphatis]|uniref:bifunctional acetate--CoA ligase family protein/GNAT family N-acetyltransferase n=1 Tax=Candidatus Accumulibacter sp. ACC012 TaxID=2823332 RepID=UPI0025B9F449|nr:GNAT family N-acetyltransferase [Candidatus Accumulibacter sp. ACC012]
MTIRNLEFLFRPRSVAIVAEPDEPSRYAEVVLRNLGAGGFSGPLISVTARKAWRFAIGTHVRLDGLDVVPDLAVVCAAPDHVPQIISQLGARGTRAVIVGMSLRDRMNSRQIVAAHKAILAAAQPYLLRVLGPGSGGLLVPPNALNASVAPIVARPGKIALLTQSASITAAVLDRADSKGIGFSLVLHLGASIDIDLADALDWLAADPDTGSILVQFDAITGGRKFMSAARAAARNKPVVYLRSGRMASRQPASEPFTASEVYAAALRRAGWVRIDTLGDLFEAAEAMARVRSLRVERLTILANGHGLGRIAADTLLASGGQLATLSKDTLKRLGERLQMRLTASNPLALPANISAENWAAALAAVLDDRDTDSVLTVCSPSPFAQSTAIAAALCKVIKDSGRNVFTCWVGGTAMLEAQRIAAAHGVLSHDSPGKAIAVFLGIVDYQRNRRLLMQMPPSQTDGFSPDTTAARTVVAEAIAAGMETLTPVQARRLLHAYGIDSAEYQLARNIDAAIRSADDIGYPVDLGLVLANALPFAALASGLRSPADIHAAVRDLRRIAKTQHPGQRVSNYLLRPSAARSGAPALRLGVADDPVFGPVIFLGPAAAAKRSGEGAFVVALPPLNPTLAQDLLARSHFAEELGGNERAALESALRTALVRLSQLLSDIDEVLGVELNPLHVETSGVLALNTRIRIEKSGRKHGLRRFAIRPYPQELEQQVDWNGRQLLIRPIRPEDEIALGNLIRSLDPEDARMRFFAAMRHLPRSQLARFTQIDYDREMALVAIERGSDGVERSLGEIRAVSHPDHAVADFAIVVSSGCKGKGLGRLLLQSLITCSRSRGIGELRGETLEGNLRMQHLAQDLGFKLTAGADRGTVDLRLVLCTP